MGSTAILHILDGLPEGFLEAPATELYRLLPGPSLIHLPGERPDALFVSILQHGNESAGLQAVQRLLAAWRGRPLPRALTLFVGNIEAARHGRRRLDRQPDYNRCWPGGELPGSAETRMMAEIVEIMRARPLFASIDIHNTTGENPRHAGVTCLDDRCLQLAHLFGRTVVHFTRPRGVQPQAFSALCPAVLLECGRVGSAFGSAHAHDYLERCLSLETIPETPLAPEAIDLFQTTAVVQVREAVRFRFGEGPEAELLLDAELDRMNFRELPAGTVLGRTRGARLPVRATSPAGHDVTAEWFELADGRLCVRRPVMPALLTRDPRIVRQDCLCNLLERMALPSAST